MAEIFDASIGTVRQALQPLVSQGFLSRTQGKGAYVNRSIEHTDSLRYYRFAGSFEDVVRPLTIHCLRPPALGVYPEAAQALGAAASTEMFEVGAHIQT